MSFIVDSATCEQQEVLIKNDEFCGRTVLYNCEQGQRILNN
jgi:hypothetical protein